MTKIDKKEVFSLFSEGYSNQEIVDAFGCTRGRISQLRKEFRVTMPDVKAQTPQKPIDRKIEARIGIRSTRTTKAANETVNVSKLDEKAMLSKEFDLDEERAETIITPKKTDPVEKPEKKQEEKKKLDDLLLEYSIFSEVFVRRVRESINNK